MPSPPAKEKSKTPTPERRSRLFRFSPATLPARTSSLIAAEPAQSVSGTPAMVTSTPLTPRKLRTLRRIKPATPSATASSLIKENYLHRVSPATLPRLSLRDAFRSSLEEGQDGGSDHPDSTEMRFSIGRAPSFQRQPLPDIWREGTLQDNLCTQEAEAVEHKDKGEEDENADPEVTGTLETVELSSVRLAPKPEEDVPMSTAAQTESINSLRLPAAQSISRSTNSNDCTRCRQLRTPPSEAPTVTEETYPALPSPMGVAPGHDAVHYAESHPDDLTPRRYPASPSQELPPTMSDPRCGSPDCVNCTQPRAVPRTMPPVQHPPCDNPNCAQCARPRARTAPLLNYPSASNHPYDSASCPQYARPTAAAPLSSNPSHSYHGLGWQYPSNPPNPPNPSYPAYPAHSSHPSYPAYPSYPSYASYPSYLVSGPPASYAAPPPVPTVPNVNITVNLGDGLVEALKVLTDELAELKFVLSTLPSSAPPRSPVMQGTPVVDLTSVELSWVVGPRPEPPTMHGSGAPTPPEHPCASQGFPRPSYEWSDNARSPIHHSTPRRHAMMEAIDPGAHTDVLGDATSEGSFYSSSSDIDVTRQRL